MNNVDDAVRWQRGNDPALVELNLQCQRRRPDGAYNAKIRADGATRQPSSQLRVHVREGKRKIEKRRE